MESKQYNCYLCGKPLIGDDITVEHIILNAIGGKLKSENLICRECNSRLGDQADAVLAEDLSFFSDMLEVKKDRKSNHFQVMTDPITGIEFNVSQAGRKTSLRVPHVPTIEPGKPCRIVAKDRNHLNAILTGKLKRGEITQSIMDQLMEHANKSVMSTNELGIKIDISPNAFPSIVKSAVNYYIERTHRNDDIKHIIPYIKGEKDCTEVLQRVYLIDSPYKVEQEQVTHMIHLEGHSSNKILYALLEYFGAYTFVVILNNNYNGPDICDTYCYDVISNSEVIRDFSFSVDDAWISDFEKQFKENAVFRRDCEELFKSNINKIMKIWSKKRFDAQLSMIVSNAFKKYEKDINLTDDMLYAISDDICNGVVKLLALDNSIID